MHNIMSLFQAPLDIPRQMLPTIRDARLRQDETQLPIPFLDHIPRDRNAPPSLDRRVPHRVDGHVAGRLDQTLHAVHEVADRGVVGQVVGVPAAKHGELVVEFVVLPGVVGGGEGEGVGEFGDVDGGRGWWWRERDDFFEDGVEVAH